MPPSGIPTPLELQLLALVVTRRSGREVAARYKDETGESISYGTLYTTFRRLKEAGWVTVHDDEDDDGRLRFFQIDAPGTKALNAGRTFYRELAGFGVPSRA